MNDFKLEDKSKIISISSNAGEDVSSHIPLKDSA